MFNRPRTTHDSAYPLATYPTWCDKCNSAISSTPHRRYCRIKPDPIPEREVDKCRHHWMLPPPNGPTAEGECRRCGEKREFPNSF